MTIRADLELWSAARVVTEHASGGTCNQCGADGCGLYDQADLLLRRWEDEHGQRYPEQAPSWQAARDPRLAGMTRC